MKQNFTQYFFSAFDNLLKHVASRNKENIQTHCFIKMLQENSNVCHQKGGQIKFTNIYEN